MHTPAPAGVATRHWARAAVNEPDARPGQAELKIRILTGLLMGAIMSFLISAIITWINTGIDAGYPGRWLRAWLVAFAIAVPLAVLLGPFARRWAEALAGR
jgi:hypothetical protein